MPDLKNDNLLFFGTVANHSAIDYLTRIKEKYNFNDEITKFHEDHAKQIVINSQIALRKFRLFNSALKWTMAGIATPISVIIYVLFFDNNK